MAIKKTTGTTAKLKNAVKNILRYKANTPKKKLAKIGALPVASALWLASWAAIDNRVLRKLAKEFSTIKTEKGRMSFLARHPKLYAHILYYGIGILMIYSGAKIIQDAIPEKQEDVKQVKTSRGKTYKIESIQDFDKIYKKTMPFACLAMFPTETLNLGTYADNGGAKNTIGLGSYWYPKNGDPATSEWIKVSQHKDVQARNFNISGNRAMNMVDSWARHREDGRVYKKMCRMLKGAELSLNELAAIFSCTYNNEKNGWLLCEFVKNNYKDPIKCASYLADLPTYGFAGLTDRHCHEALVYLNLDDYISYIPNMEIRGITTSVTALETGEFNPMLKDLRKGKLDGARVVANKIKKRIFKNGEKVSAIITKNLGAARARDILGSPGMVTGGTLMLSPNLGFNADSVYKKGVASYTKGDYEKALASFKSVIENGFDGADIHNYLAITYLHLKRYREAIDEARLVLSMGEASAHPAANFNAGLAYEKLGETKSAIANFKAAMQRDPNAKAYQKAYERVTETTTAKKSKITLQHKTKFDNAKTKTIIKQAPVKSRQKQKTR